MWVTGEEINATMTAVMRINWSFQGRTALHCGHEHGSEGNCGSNHNFHSC